MNDLSLHIIDIIQNSVSAGATRIELTVEEDLRADTLRIMVCDNGCGMNAEQLGRLSDPFFTTRTTRNVGMGIPLFRQNAERTGGSLTVESELGRGTTVTAIFAHSHVDRPPLGNLANSFILMVSANPEIDFALNYIFDKCEYHFDTVEIREVLDGMPLNDTHVIGMLNEMVGENIKELSTAP